MFNLSVELVFLFVFSLASLGCPRDLPDDVIKHASTLPTTEKIDYMNLESAITCKFQPNGYDCDRSRTVFPIFYYDIKLEDCKAFNIGSCPNNLNGYDNLNECHMACRDAGGHSITTELPSRVFCRLQYDFGHCNEYHPRWYYDLSTRTCKGFSYSGCGGNLNRFISQEFCISTCVALGQSGFE